MYNVYLRPGDLDPAQALAILNTAPSRLGTAWYGPVIEILYKERWLHLARTDLKDDVCTGRPGYTLDKFKQLVRYGARISDDTFAVIDSLSDG